MNLWYQFEPPKEVSAKPGHATEYATRYWTNLYSRNLTLDGTTVAAGTRVTAVNGASEIIGEGIVEEGGKFGFMPVYGDDPMTEEVEGVANGGDFRLIVGDVETDNEFTWNRDILKMELSGLISHMALPKEYELSQNYPNPFNPSTRIEFALPVAGHVAMDVYDILGRKVLTLVDEYREAGRYTVEWDAVDNSGRRVSTGVYFYRIKSGGFEKSQKMLLLK